MFTSDLEMLELDPIYFILLIVFETQGLGWFLLRLLLFYY